jgi:hypothetical protein
MRALNARVHFRRGEPTLRKLLIGAIAASATLAVAVTAIAQTPAQGTFTASAKPSNAGTKKKPKNTTLSFATNVTTPNATADKIIVKLPSGLKFSGKGFKRCSFDELANTLDMSVCPSGSKAGPKGTANALVGPASSPNKAPLNFDVYPFVQDSSTFIFFLSQQGGGVQRPLQGKLSNGGRTLTITIPFDLRQPGGLDASLVGISQKFSGKRKGKYIVSSTACKNHKWKIGSEITFTTRADGTPPPTTLKGSKTVHCSK